MPPKKGAFGRGSGEASGRQAKPQRTPLELCTTWMEEAAASESKAERYGGPEAIQSYRNAFEKYGNVLGVRDGATDEVREMQQDALEGSARCQWHLAELEHNPTQCLAHLTEAKARYEQVAKADGTNAESLYNLGLVASKFGDVYRELGQREQAISSYDYATNVLTQTLNVLAGLAFTSPEELVTRLEDQVEAAIALGDVLSTAAVFLPDLALFGRVAGTFEQMLQLDSQQLHPSIKIAWATALQVEANFRWESSPKELRSASAENLPSAIADRAASLLSEALLNPNVNPVEGLCLRADVLYDYALMLVEVSSAPTSPVELLSRAYGDLSKALELESTNPDIISKIGDVWLALFKCPPSPTTAESGSRLALETAMVWYRKAMSIPFKPYRDADTFYNAATALALLVDHDAACRDFLVQWLDETATVPGPTPKSPRVRDPVRLRKSVAELVGDADFDGFRQREIGRVFLSSLYPCVQNG